MNEQIGDLCVLFKIQSLFSTLYRCINALVVVINLYIVECYNCIQNRINRYQFCYEYFKIIFSQNSIFQRKKGKSFVITRHTIIVFFVIQSIFIFEA